MTVSTKTIASAAQRLLAIALVMLLAALTGCGGSSDIWDPSYDPLTDYVPSVISDNNLSAEYASKRYWVGKSRLIMSDFVDLPSRIDAKGETAYNIDVNIDYADGVLTYQVTPVLDASSSWIDKSLDPAHVEETLAHENLHFDIAEMQAGRCRHDLAALAGTGISGFALEVKCHEIVDLRCKEWLNTEQMSLDQENAMLPVEGNLQARWDLIHRWQHNIWGTIDNPTVYLATNGSVRVN